MQTVHDLEFFLTYQYWPVNEAVMSFKVLEIAATSRDDRDIEYRIKGGTGADLTRDVNAAEVLLSGDIKFDGCCNVQFESQDDCMPHFCGNPADRFREIFNRLYGFAAALMPEHASYLAAARD